MGFDRTHEQRITAFMSWVKKDDETGCWLWQGEIRRDGYGECWAFGKRKRAHQASFRELKCETLQPGQVLRHTCDNSACCNPEHIIAGTQADNIRDKVARNRQAKGERHGMVKLTEDKVLKIILDPRAQRAIAKDYGVTQVLVGKIKRREIWAHVEVPDA